MKLMKPLLILNIKKLTKKLFSVDIHGFKSAFTILFISTCFFILIGISLVEIILLIIKLIYIKNKLFSFFLVRKNLFFMCFFLIQTAVILAIIPNLQFKFWLYSFVKNYKFNEIRTFLSLFTVPEKEELCKFMAQRVVPVAVYDFKHFGRPRQIRSMLEEAGVKYEFVKVYAGADEDIVLQKHKVVVPANAPLNMFTHNSYKIYRIQGGDGSHIMEVLDWYYP